MHISGEDVSFLKPIEITDTHVVVDVPHLSSFGLVWNALKKLLKPVSSQVLLFLPQNTNTDKQNLNVFLLPKNVPLEEVKIFKMLQLSVQTFICDTHTKTSWIATDCHCVRGEDASHLYQMFDKALLVFKVNLQNTLH